ncbi:hypothetical protein B0H14DRAFT_3086138 [Mycena olivaceomarginata]|nr:hypothetical protein B0H14DRAFT_3086138 [Mycena olivaceomarginata]
MSFAKLKATRQVKQSYVTSNTLPTSPESSAVPSEAVHQHAEQTENIYKSIPEYLEIRTSPTSGRGLWTTKPCNPGQVILAVKPHAAALSNERLDLYCSQCFGEGNHASLKRCTKCQAVYYCDSTCQNADWPLHKNECVALQRILASGETSIPSEAIRCLGPNYGPLSAWTREIDLLQSHTKDIEPAAYELHAHLAISLVRYLGLSSPSEIASFGMASGADLANFVSRFVTNTFTITDPSLTPLGVSVSPPVALINHSCDPNAVVEPLMQVIALRDIVAGEEILTAYIDTTLPKALRQASLRETYLFSCACALCTSAVPVDPRESVWCPKACGGMCPTPTEGKPCPPPNSLSQCTKCRAVLQKTDEVLDAVRIGQQALDKATLLQFSDPAKSKQLSSKLGPPRHHTPSLALTRLHTALLIADLHHPQSQAQSDAPTTPTPTPTEAQAALDEAVVAATKAVTGLEGILHYGHPLLAVDEPAPRAPGTAAEEALRYPPSGVKRLRLALETLMSARGELGVGFGAPNEGGVVGRTVRDDIVRLERELAVWKKGLGEALRDAKEAKTGLS